MLTVEDKAVLHRFTARARTELDTIDRDVDNAGDQVVSSGAIASVMRLSEIVAHLTIGIGREWGER